MNRFIYGRGWVFNDETNGEGDGNGDAGGAAAGGGGEGGDAGSDGSGDGAGGDGDGAAGDGKSDAAAGGKAEPKTMEEAIAQGLAKTAPKKVDEDPAAKDAADAAAAAKAEKHANGAPKKDAKGNELDDQGKVTKAAEAPKAKTSAELQMSKEQLAALKPESRARFAEVITTLKAREGEIATLTEQMKPLAEARDTMITILQETNTSSDQLSAYLEFNRMLQSKDAKDLESALGMVNAQRTALLKVLGKEEPGVDLLAEFPDLQAEVNDATITRERALEIAQSRRNQAAAEARNRQQNTHHQNANQIKQAQQKAQTDISTWCAGLAKNDIDYKAKEEKLLEQVDQVIKDYPPNQWLPTLKLLYTGIVIQKAAAPKGHQPIRPTGAKPGAKTPQNMYEAMWGGKGE